MSKKLSPHFNGPYTIDSVISPSALCLRLPSSLRIHPVSRLLDQVLHFQCSPLWRSLLHPIASRFQSPAFLSIIVNKILAIKLCLLIAFCMWVKAVKNNMTHYA
ncbi:hypothetical protein AMECASPLE_026444 [Ameca splendens]|uniref:Tf2-1-like SH3-like domain-containing protein n=1 Tax=Ameca splendens TaxID=208324 RepID=A0ABV0Y5F4_9TELE